jgi:predicted DsbA family dithiol-disulfide isomerase
VTTLRIDVWSDIGCPWCYVGKKRLETAIAASPHAASIELVPHSFELDATASTDPVSLPGFLAAKMGVSLAEAVRMDGHVGAMAHDEGLPYTSDRVHANSFDAHRVIHLAAEHGLANEMLGVVQRELFSGHANVYGHAFLADAAAGLGIPRARAEEVLASDEFADAVHEDQAEAGRLGVTGVPFVVVGGRYGIPGAIAVSGYTQTIERAWAEA